ncbi:MAG: hypothetical protein ACLFTB_08875 [Desulfovibrionales bacterium]
MSTLRFHFLSATSVTLMLFCFFPFPVQAAGRVPLAEFIAHGFSGQVLVIAPPAMDQAAIRNLPGIRNQSAMLLPLYPLLDKGQILNFVSTSRSLPRDKDILLICWRGGSTADRGYALLVEQGFDATRLWILDEGLQGLSGKSGKRRFERAPGSGFQE